MPTARTDRNSILWRCRRGTRELDVLLSGFVNSHYAQLDAEARACFRQLLEESDPDIMAWIVGTRASHARYRDIVHSLQQFAERLSGD